MADSTQKRRRKAAVRVERQRRAALAVAAKTARRPSGPGNLELPPPPPMFPGEFDGGAGVREPRRPRPGMPAGAMELEFVDDVYLGMESVRHDDRIPDSLTV